jgi:hypothetical protein
MDVRDRPEEHAPSVTLAWGACRSSPTSMDTSEDERLARETRRTLLAVPKRARGAKVTGIA